LYKALICSGIVRLLSNISLDILQPWVAQKTAKLSCFGQYFMCGPPSQSFDSDAELWRILVCSNISLNLATKRESGVTYIFIGVLKIFFMLGAASVKSTAGIGNASFVFSGDS